MRKNNPKFAKAQPTVAPGIDPEDSYGEEASQEEIQNNDSTQVTRLILDEYEPSDNE